MRMYKIFFCACVLGAFFLGACDLQPRIASIPDSIGMFIEDRYPALLADPYTQPEIYNSAVTDYGVYASPELYGNANINDYVLYASINDYVLVPEQEEDVKKTEQKIEQEIADDYLIVPLYGTPEIIEEKKNKYIEKNTDEIIVVRGDTLYSLARKNNMSVSEFAKINNLQEPYTLSIGQKLTTQRQSTIEPGAKKEIPNLISKEKVAEIKSEKVLVKETIKPNKTTRVGLKEITVSKGDTLYSISRKYEIPVNDLAVMNKISAPFTLSVGQKIKVPNLDKVETRSPSEIKTPAKAPATITPAKNDVKPIVVQQNKNTPKVERKQKISSNPKQQLPKITARSASKFSWPLRGKILSGYGAKNNGLFNDGINIAASIGATVKAAENGVVAYAGNEVKGMGNLIIIQHSDGWMTIYAHLDSMSVKRGTRVNVGTPIGRAGKTGKVDKPQLHFEIRKGTKAYNPTQYLKK